MADDLLHSPAPDLVSDEVLTAMERDGWTPTQVRALIASYQRLKTSYCAIAVEFDAYRTQVETAALDLAKLQEEGEELATDVEERTRGMVSRG